MNFGLWSLGQCNAHEELPGVDSFKDQDQEACNIVIIIQELTNSLTSPFTNPCCGLTCSPATEHWSTWTWWWRTLYHWWRGCQESQHQYQRGQLHQGLETPTSGSQEEGTIQEHTWAFLRTKFNFQSRWLRKDSKKIWKDYGKFYNGGRSARVILKIQFFGGVPNA